GSGTYVFAVRELPRRQGSRDRRRHVPRPRPAGARDRATGMGPGAVGDRLCLRRIPHRGRNVSVVGQAHAARRGPDVLGRGGAGSADFRHAPRQHSSALRRDRESVSHPGQGMNVAVVGGGAWGTTLADLMARKGASVRLWVREPEVVESINNSHRNELFLPGASLAPTMRATGDIGEAVRNAEVVVSAAPSHAVRDIMTQAATALTGKPLVISVSKGLDPDRLELLSVVLRDVIGSRARIAVLSGPSFAQEVYERQPTAV